MNQKMIKMIDEFLEETRKSRGGWAPVEPQDEEQLDEIIDALVNAKWSADPDGDRPMRWKLIDRTKYEPMHFQPVEYDHKTNNPLRILRDHLSNLKVAQDKVDMMFRLYPNLLKGPLAECKEVPPEDEEE